MAKKENKYKGYDITTQAIHTGTEYDIKGRKYVGANRKYYFSDVGIVDVFAKNIEGKRVHKQLAVICVVRCKKCDMRSKERCNFCNFMHVAFRLRTCV